MRTITEHHDGHGLTDNLLILADEPGPGGASHFYAVLPKGSDYTKTPLWFHNVLAVPTDAHDPVALISYQKGPLREEGSQAGLIDSVMLTIVADRLKAFQAGPYACAENENALVHINAALVNMKKRADDRAKRGVIGKLKP